MEIKLSNWSLKKKQKQKQKKKKKKPDLNLLPNIFTHSCNSNNKTNVTFFCSGHAAKHRGQLCVYIVIATADTACMILT